MDKSKASLLLLLLLSYDWMIIDHCSGEGSDWSGLVSSWVHTLLQKYEEGYGRDWFHVRSELSFLRNDAYAILKNYVGTNSSEFVYLPYQY